MLPTGPKPTREQVDVVAARDPKLVVMAAAGSGKTFTLVERYLRYVQEDGLKPDQILTITFTRKAAAVMKGRIVARLRDLGLLEEAQTAETGPIQTIHAFCERLLRENSLAAGLDPRFEILGEADYADVVERAVRDAISDPGEECEQAQALIAELAGKSRYGSGSPYGRLQEAVREALSEFRGSGANVATVIGEFGEPNAVLGSWQGRVLQSSPAEVRKAFLESEGSDSFPLRYRDAVLAAGLKLREHNRPFSAPSLEDVDREAAEHTAGVIQLATSAWRRIEREMERAQKLDFTALESKAIELLCESPEVVRRLQGQYKAVMVDEAQDVNPLQYRLINQLQLQSELLVGDPQQSIYGFRQADMTLLGKHAETATRLRLSENHRSDEGILLFVDKLFSNLWGNEYVEMLPRTEPMDLDGVEVPAYPGVELWEQENRDPYVTATYVEDLINEGVERRDIAILVRKSRFGSDIQEALKTVGIESKIVGGSEKFYTRLEIRDLANILRALGDISDDFALAAALRSPVAGLSLDSIAALAQLRPIYAHLEEFMPQSEEDQATFATFLKWFIPLSKYADRLSAWEVLSEVLASSPYLVSLAQRKDSPQLLANARKLLSLACQSPELGPLEFSERIREIRELRHREGDAPAIEDTSDVVTIINIHKAKGLEYPVVVVPQTHDLLTNSGGDLEIDTRLRMIVTNFGKQRSVYYNWLLSLRQERDRQEELRVLYVALTRAQNRLCVVSHGSVTKDCLARRIANVFAWKRQPPVGFRIRSQNQDS